MMKCGSSPRREIALFKSRLEKEKCRPARAAQEWGYVTAPIGGVNPRFGSTVTADLSPLAAGIYSGLYQRALHQLRAV